MNILITGAAGFLGKHLVERCVRDGHYVAAIDSKTGWARDSPAAQTFETKMEGLDDFPFPSLDALFHLAAFADVRSGAGRPQAPFWGNTAATFRLLDWARGRVKRIVFTSSAAVYGDTRIFPSTESGSWPRQVSMYGASKVACEAMLEAYSHNYGIHAVSLRLVSMLGPGYRHGHVVDWYKQLMEHPDRLEVLGNGQQRRQYVDVRDVVDVCMQSLDLPEMYHRFNVARAPMWRLRDSVTEVCGILRLKPKVLYGVNPTWVGDQPRIEVDTTRFPCQRSIAQAYEDTVRDLQANPKEVLWESSTVKSSS